MQAELEATFGKFKALFDEMKQLLEGMKLADGEREALQGIESAEGWAAQRPRVEELKGRYEGKMKDLEGLMQRFKEVPLVKPPKPMLPDEGQTLAPTGHTPKYVVEKMVELAELSEHDILYDLGSGDGRIVFEAVRRYRIQAGGVEANPIWYKFARERALFLKLKSHVDFLLADALTVDLSRATVVTLSLSAEGNLKLRPKLQEELRPGSRIISHQFDMGDWEPEVKVPVKDALNEWHWVYRWRIPEKVESKADEDRPIWEDIGDAR